MKPRMVHVLADAADEKLIREVARGLTLLLEHVAELHKSVETIVKNKHARGIAAIQTIADEEAAKYLILLDAIRCPPSAKRELSQQLRRCSNHLAKDIYAYVSRTSPADLAEVRRMLKSLRVSHYLDGPMDVDWIFRNEIIDQRERTLYVDYVRTDQGDEWVAPDIYDDRMFLHPGPSGPVRLIFSLSRAGLTTEAGLRVVGSVWRDFVPQSSTHWQEVASYNRRTLRLLEEAGVLREDFSPEDARGIVNDWSFPLHHEDLTEIPVDVEQLREKQRQWTVEF
jgi:AbiV family abortive infection protein